MKTVAYQLAKLETTVGKLSLFIDDLKKDIQELQTLMGCPEPEPFEDEEEPAIKQGWVVVDRNPPDYKGIDAYFTDDETDDPWDSDITRAYVFSDKQAASNLVKRINKGSDTIVERHFKNSKLKLQVIRNHF